MSVLPLLSISCSLPLDHRREERTAEYIRREESMSIHDGHYLTNLAN